MQQRTFRRAGNDIFVEPESEHLCFNIIKISGEITPYVVPPDNYFHQPFKILFWAAAYRARAFARDWVSAAQCFAAWASKTGYSMVAESSALSEMARRIRMGSPLR